MEKQSSPLRPVALINFRKVDAGLSKIVGNFWKLIWEYKAPARDQKTKSLLSLSNAVGGGRHRQATRELIKAYAFGTTVGELDEIFSLFVWNQGAGYFASEIGPSQLFAAYQLIKNLEKQGLPQKQVVEELLKHFGEENPAVGTGHRKP